MSLEHVYLLEKYLRKIIYIYIFQFPSGTGRLMKKMHALPGQKTSFSISLFWGERERPTNVA